MKLTHFILHSHTLLDKPASTDKLYIYFRKIETITN